MRKSTRKIIDSVDPKQHWCRCFGSAMDTSILQVVYFSSPNGRPWTRLADYNNSIKGTTQVNRKGAIKNEPAKQTHSTPSSLHHYCCFFVWYLSTKLSCVEAHNALLSSSVISSWIALKTAYCSSTLLYGLIPALLVVLLRTAFSVLDNVLKRVRQYYQSVGQMEFITFIFALNYLA